VIRGLFNPLRLADEPVRVPYAHKDAAFNPAYGAAQKRKDSYGEYRGWISAYGQKRTLPKSSPLR
jgi:hypothetical protein